MIVDRYKTLLQTHENWLLDRPVIASNNTDPLRIAVNLQEEVEEMNDALLDHLIVGSPDTLKELAQELADLVLYTLQLFKIFELDMYSELMEKLAFNQMRYDAKSFSNGRTYDEARVSIKLWTAQRRIKEQFYGNG